MIDMSSTIKNTVAISNFNKGQAGQIFEDVKKNGTKVVIKNNNPECVLMAPDEYLLIMEELSDAKLLNLALERLKNAKEDDLISEEEVLTRYGLTKEQLANNDEVDFE